MAEFFYSHEAKGGDDASDWDNTSDFASSPPLVTMCFITTL